MQYNLSNNKRVFFLSILIACLGGLGLGYLLFNQKGADTNTMQQTEEHVHGDEESIWTCSMHPQIRQNEPGDCPICGMDLIPLEKNTSSDPLSLEMTPEAIKLASIETTIIGLTTLVEKKLSLAGKIKADERLAASQVAHIPGRIEKLYVSFTGERIRKGQKIASLYSPEMISAQKELLEALKLNEANPDLLTSARKKLEFWKISKEIIEEIEKEGKIRETFPLIADASGIVTKRKIAVGDYVKQGEVLFDMISLSRLWVLFDAYEDDLGKISVGDQVKFTVAGLTNIEFSTKITFIDPIINPNTRVASIRGEINNSRRLLKPEMFVKGSLQSLMSPSEKLLVPKSAVLWTGQRSVVYVKVPGRSVPTFRYQELDLGERKGDSYLVESGLSAGEEVVSYGSFSIDAAAQLNNQQSMMNRLVGSESPASTGIPNFVATTPIELKQQLTALVKEYISLKDALVSTDAVSAGNNAKVFVKKIETIDMKLLSGDAHNFWMEKLNVLRTHGSLIVGSKDVEEQRNQFNFLSTALIEAVQGLGIAGEIFYVQHCPMAMNDQGADWLSLKEEIKNPYFGDAMLTCGSNTYKFPLVPQENSSNSNPNQFHNH